MIRAQLEAPDSLSLLEVGAPQNAQVQVRILHTPAELKSAQPMWEQWCTDPRATIDALMISANCRPGVVGPYVLAVYRGDKLDCLLVGQLEERCVEQKLGYAVLWHCNRRAVCFSRRGLLGNASNENCKLLISHVSELLAQGGADFAVFSDLRVDSPLRALLQAESGILRRQSYCATQRHNALQFPTNFVDYFSSLSRKDRHELRRHERMLERDFPDQVRVRCIHREDEVEGLLDAIDEIARKTYQRALGTGFEKTPELEEQYRIAASAGDLRAWLLYIQEKPCAFFLGRKYKSTFFAEYTGYDPEYGKYSPGIFLLLHSIQHSLEQVAGVMQFDLGSGDYTYKRAVCNVGWQEGTAYLYAPSWRGFLLNVQITCMELTNGVLRKMAKRYGILKKARKLWQKRTLLNFRSACVTGD